jgi:DNA recombination protein RmuC
MLIIVALAIIIGLLIANLLMLNSRSSPPTATEIGQALTFPTTTDIATALAIPTPETITKALGASLNEQKISEKIGAFTELSRSMEDTTKKFNQMVSTKSKRAGWGEWHLDLELKEAFPGVKIRQEVKELGNLKPDAHMRTPDGKILIVDSKFVYDTYNKILETPETQVKTVEKLLTTFRGDIETHVNKIKTDYVQPGKGTHEFAFMFIPSEGVYHFLIENESKTVRWAATQGVVICSPMTLMANMHMLEIARMAQNMKEAHNEILDTHLRVQKSYGEFEEDWKILSKHLLNSLSKHTEVTGKLNLLNIEITALSALDKSIEEGAEEE